MPYSDVFRHLINYVINPAKNLRDLFFICIFAKRIVTKRNFHIINN